MRLFATLLFALLAFPFCSVASAAGSVTITSPFDDQVFVDDPRPDFAGTAEEGTVTIEIFSGGTASGTPVESVVRPVVAGAWATEPETNLADGLYRLRVTQGEASAITTFWVDLLAPTPSIAEPMNGSATEDRTPTLRGSRGATPGDSENVTLEIFAGSATTPLWSTTMAVGDAWVAVPGIELADGEYTLVVNQEDDAGHVGASEVAFAVDNVAPVLSIEQPSPDTRLPYLSGLAGTALGDDDRVLVEVFSGPAAEGEPVFSREDIVADGRWATAASLGEGVFTLRVTQADWLEHVTTLTRTFRRDVTDPTLTVETPAESSTVAGPRPVFSGVAGTATGDASSVEVTVRGVTATIPVVDGRWSGTVPVDLPASRAAIATVTQRDAAGNLTMIRRRFTIAAQPVTPPRDTTAPKVVLPSRVSLRRGRFHAVVRMNEPATAVLTLKLGRRVLATGSMTDGTRARLKPRRGALARLRRAKRRPTLVVRATDRAGNTTRVRRAVRVRRR